LIDYSIDQSINQPINNQSSNDWLRLGLFGYTSTHLLLDEH